MKNEGRRLAALTHHARDCKTKLEEKHGLANRILALAELARKLETEREKVRIIYTRLPCHHQ